MPVVQSYSTGAYVYVPDPPRMQEVTGDLVDGEVKSLAELLLDVVVDDLGLAPRPEIKWFDQEHDSSKRLRERYGDDAVPWVTFESPRDIKGVVLGKAPTTIWLRADLGLHEVVQVVFHEGKHVHQYQEYLAGRAAVPDDAADEREAEAYAEKLLAQLEALPDLPPRAPTPVRRPMPKQLTYRPATARPAAPRPAPSPYERKRAEPFYGRCYDCGDTRIPIPSPTRHVCKSTSRRTT